MTDDVASSFDVNAAMDELVESGRFPTREAVMREGVRLVQEQAADLARIRAGVLRGIADAEAGRVMDADEAFDELDAYFRELAEIRNQ